MKNAKRAVALATAAFVSILMFTSASEWEGAGAIAGPGELPDTGLYVATNAFPRNTVVDVMNLENEKTVRVIVAGPLNAPGLLISLSREAASVLKLSSREVGRFRVSMPVDPVAYSRFAEGLASNTDPDYNPMSAIERAGSHTGREEETGSREEPDTASAAIETEEVFKSPSSQTLVEAPVPVPASSGADEPLVPEVIEVRPAPDQPFTQTLSSADSEPLPPKQPIDVLPDQRPSPVVNLPPVSEIVPPRPELVELPPSPREGQAPAASVEAIPPVQEEKGPDQELVIVRVIEAPAEANPPATESDALVSFDAPADKDLQPAESGPEYSEVPGMARSQNGIHPDEEPRALAVGEEVETPLADVLPPEAEERASVEDSQPLAEEGKALALEEEPQAPAPVLPELVELPGSAGEDPLPEALEPGYTEPPVEELVETRPVEEPLSPVEEFESGPDVALVVEGERPANGIHPDEEPGTPDLRIVALEKSALSLEQAEARPPESGPAPALPAEGEIAPIVAREEVLEAEEAARIADDAPFVDNLLPAEPTLASETLPKLDESRVIAALPQSAEPVQALPALPSLPSGREVAGIPADEAPALVEAPLASLVGKTEIAALADEPPAKEDASAELTQESVAAPLPEKVLPTVTEEPAVLPARSFDALDLPVPVISSLVRGRYYLQICAVAHLDSLAEELARHSRYPLVVHPDTSGGKTVYRLLVGPVNQGESGALLSRFKRSGYRDAFIKKG